MTNHKSVVLVCIGEARRGRRQQREVFRDNGKVEKGRTQKGNCAEQTEHYVDINTICTEDVP